MENDGMTYAGVGVHYDELDLFKRSAQQAARETAGNLTRFGFAEVAASRGESCYLVETPRGFLLAHVEEGLGTKSLVADAMYTLTGDSYYGRVAQDTVAMIVNDMITVGALPFSVAMHCAVGDSSWFDDEQRSRDLIEGWAQACDFAQCTWGPGETPTLQNIVVPGTVVLSGSATGIVAPKERLIASANIRHGDAIVLVASSGIHANGLTLARKIADVLPDGYLTQLDDGRTYGEVLLDPTYIYVPFVEDCFDRSVTIHYAVNITGHGWRKLMRAPQPFVYVVERLPEPHPVFGFIQRHGNVAEREMYGTFNMGVGFALYVDSCDAKRVVDAARDCGLDAWVAGYVEKRSDQRKVVIEPLGIEYSADTLKIR